jgi:hypothetical protein
VLPSSLLPHLRVEIFAAVTRPVSERHEVLTLDFDQSHSMKIETSESSRSRMADITDLVKSSQSQRPFKLTKSRVRILLRVPKCSNHFRIRNRPKDLPRCTRNQQRLVRPRYPRKSLRRFQLQQHLQIPNLRLSTHILPQHLHHQMSPTPAKMHIVDWKQFRMRERR